MNPNLLTFLVNSVNHVEKVTKGHGVKFDQNQFFFLELCENMESKGC